MEQAVSLSASHILKVLKLRWPTIHGVGAEDQKGTLEYKMKLMTAQSDLAKFTLSWATKMGDQNLMKKTEGALSRLVKALEDEKGPKEG